MMKKPGVVLADLNSRCSLGLGPRPASGGHASRRLAFRLISLRLIAKVRSQAAQCLSPPALDGRASRAASAVGRAASILFSSRAVRELTAVSVGCLLAFAGLMKLSQATSSPVAIGGVEAAARWAAIFIDLLLGASLISFPNRRVVLRMAAILFAIYAMVSLGSALAGLGSCGCFGRAKVSPWLMSVLDAIVSVVMYACARFLLSKNCLSGHNGVALLGGFRPIAIAVTLIAVVFYDNQKLSTVEVPPELGTIVRSSAHGQSLKLRPEGWHGKQFPVLPYLQISPQSRHAIPQGKIPEWVNSGKKDVIFHQPGCDECYRTLLTRMDVEGVRGGGVDVLVVSLTDAPDKTLDSLLDPYRHRVATALFDPSLSATVSSRVVIRLINGKVAFLKNLDESS